MTKILIIVLGVVLLSCSDKNGNDSKRTNQKNEVQQKEEKSIHQQDLENYSQNIITDTIVQDYKIAVTSVESLTDKSIGSFNNPKFTLNGKNLIFTTQNYSQLWKYNFKDKTIEKIVDLPQCGNHFQISGNNSIYFRNRAIKGKKKGGVFSILKYSIFEKKIDVIYSSEKRISPPSLVHGNICILENGSPKQIDLTSGKVNSNFNVPFYFVEDNNLLKISDVIDTLTILNKKFRFITCEYSKDGEYIFALTARNGTIIIDLNGNPINQFMSAIGLSKLYKSNLIVYTVEKDDGQKITSSDLFVGFMNHTIKEKLDNNLNELRFNPEWSPTDNKIAYNTDYGLIKIISFNIEKKSK